MRGNTKFKDDFLDRINEGYTRIEDGETKDATLKRYLTLFADEQLGQFEELFNKDIYNFNKEELLQAYAAIGVSDMGSLKSMHSLIKKYIVSAYDKKISNVLIPATSAIQGKDLTQCISQVKRRGKYMTKKELYNGIKNVPNYSDKAQLVCVWNKIMGKDYIELRNLKKSDFNYEERTITLPDRIVYLQDFEAEIILNAMNEQQYKIFNEKVSDDPFNYYDLIESDYIFRHIHSNKVEKDFDYSQAVGSMTLKNRLVTMKKVIKEPFWTMVTIYHSSIVNSLFEIKQQGWTRDELIKYIASNKLKATPETLKNVMEVIYDKLQHEK